ncbi:MAG: cbb3-type cytochrome c oxidase subunit I [Rubrivivax sp.]
MNTLVSRSFAPGLPLHRYTLAVPTDERRRLATAWLLLAVAALVASGLFSLLLVAARTPGVGALLPGVDFFHVALVVHVDLSVLVWFGSMAGLLWTVAGGAGWMGFGWAALALAVLGTAGMVAAPFVQHAPPLMSNYVPVLDGPVFTGALALFGLGLAAATWRALVAPGRVGVTLPGEGALHFGLNAAAVSAALGVAAFVWSWLALRNAGEPAVGKTFYETLFWGPGHVLQFTWTLLMLVAWAWLASAVEAPLPLSPRVAVLLFGVALVAVFATPPIYLAWSVGSPEHVRLFTWLMRFGGGLAILPFVLAIGVALVRGGRVDAAQRPLRNAVLASVGLFCTGGLMGFMIQGSDVRVPAHYHGAIVGVTLALMGVAYRLLPALGHAAPQSRLAAWQPWVYGGGQFLHIVGLVWSGGYGVQRKVAGAAQVLRTPQEVAGMGLMGLGGLIAIVGGLLFIVVVLRALRPAAGRR